MSTGESTPGFKGKVAAGTALGLSVVALAVSFWPVWKGKSFEFGVACPPNSKPEVTTISLSNDHPDMNITCRDGETYSHPTTIQEIGRRTLQGHDMPILRVNTTETVGRVQSNDVTFSIHQDPSQHDTSKVAVSNDDLVFITGAYFQGS